MLLLISARKLKLIDARALNQLRNVLNFCNSWLNIVSKKSTQICSGAIAPIDPHGSASAFVCV